MKTVLSLLSLAFLTVPAFADFPDCTLTPEGLLSEPTQAPAVADLKITGALFDREIIVHYQGNEFMWLFKGGCAVAAPLLMGPDPTVPPAATPQKTPVLHGGGAEIGA